MPFYIINKDIKHVVCDAVIDLEKRELLVKNGMRIALRPSTAEQVQETNLESILEESLNIAASKQMESIALPMVSSKEVNGVVEKSRLYEAVRLVKAFLMEHDLSVYLVVKQKDTFREKSHLYTSVQQYIDKHYARVHRSVPEPSMYDDLPDIEEQCNVDSSNIKQQSKINSSDILDQCAKLEYMKSASVLEKPSKRSLDQLLSGMEETFSQMLLRLIDERKMTDVQTYRKANIDRRLFSKIRSDQEYLPSKKTILAFAIALNLSLDETIDLLKKAGYTLSNSTKFDVIISYFIENKEYDIFVINEVLFSYHLPLLGE